MVPLACTTGRAPSVRTSAVDSTSARMGGPWRAQPCWRASCVGRHCRSRQQQREWRRQRRQLQPHAALLDPPPFDPAKLRVEYLPGGRDTRLELGRRYTLTHNDVTGSLQLSIGREYNRRQLDGWYTRIVRDEILAEWRDTAPPLGGVGCGSGSGSDDGLGAGGGGGGAAPRPSLHVYCHVSGEELWPAPPQLRSFIFQREMTLVLDTILHAELSPGGLLAPGGLTHLAAAPIYVHLRSDLPALDRVVEWGVLGERSTWRTAQSSIMRSLMSSVMGTMDEADATDGSNGSWSRSSFSSASAASSASASWDEPVGGGCGGSSSEGEGEEQPPTLRRQQPQQQHEQQQQHPGDANGGGSLPAAAPPPVAASSPPGSAAAVTAAGGGGCALANGSGSSSSSSSSAGLNGNGAARLPASSIGSSNSSSSSSAGVGAANSAVSLAAAHQMAERVERASTAWLGMPTAGDGPQCLPAVEVVVSRQR